MGRRRLNSEGSIFEAPKGSGVWWAQLSPDEDGKRPKRRAGSAREAQRLLEDLKAQRKRGINLTERNTVRQFLAYWLSDVVKPSVKPRTHEGYADLVRWYIEPFIGDIWLHELTTAHVRRMLNRLLAGGGRDQKPLAVATVQNIWTRLKTALDVAVTERRILENPARSKDLKLPRGDADDAGDDRVGRALSSDQVAALLAVAADHRLYALYHLAITLGPRQGELIGLRWTDLDWRKRTLRIERQYQRVEGKLTVTTLKTRRSKRTLHLTEDHIRVLRRHWENQQEERRLDPHWREHGLIFASEAGTPLCDSNLRRGLGRLLKRANVTRIRFHDLRHTAGSLMIAAGVTIADVSAVLGHANAAITARIYIHSSDEGKQRAAEAVARLLRGVI